MMGTLPFSLLPLAVYLIGSVSFDPAAPGWGGTLTTVPLISGVSWSLTLSDALLALGIAALVAASVRAARPDDRAVPRSLVAVIAVGIYVVMFLTVALAATSLFFALAALALAEALATVAIPMAAGHAEREAPAE